MTSQPDGSCLKQSLYFVWDLEVAEDWEPRAADGEVACFERWDTNPSPNPNPNPNPNQVACFERWDMTRLEREVREGELLRPAMRLVMADFLIRHGAITPDNEADYERIVLAMHQERLVL